ncbi:hypothetical protein GH733_016098 [Mirounga leonina]|nr:hypothetical protein GH733_016098 [Mirounga leonina]
MEFVPPTSAMPPKFDPNEIQVVYLRCTGGEVGATSALAPKIGPLGLSPKKVGDDIAKATGLQIRLLWFPYMDLRPLSTLMLEFILRKPLSKPGIRNNRERAVEAQGQVEAGSRAPWACALSPVGNNTLHQSLLPEPCGGQQLHQGLRELPLGQPRSSAPAETPATQNEHTVVGDIMALLQPQEKRSFSGLINHHRKANWVNSTDTANSSR